MTDVVNAVVLLANFVLVPATVYGCQLALGALGVTLVYGVLRFSNFAHGETMAFGAMVSILFTWLLQSAEIGLGPLPTALLALPAGDRGRRRPVCLVIDRWVLPLLSPQESGARHPAGRQCRRHVRDQRAHPLRDRPGRPGVHRRDARFVVSVRQFKEATGLREGLAIKTTQTITVAVTAILVLWLFWLPRQDADGQVDARLLGQRGTWPCCPASTRNGWWRSPGSSSARWPPVAGTLYGLDKSFKPFVYLSLLLPIFAAAIVGGLGSPLGAITGGFVVAFSEVLITYPYKKFLTYLGPEGWRPDGLVQLLSTDYKFAVSFFILVVVLVVKPTGIFGGKST